MRDLGQGQLQSSRVAIPKSVAVRILALLVIAGVIFILRDKIGWPGAGGVVLREAQSGLTPVAVDEVSDLTEGGTQLTTQTIALRDMKYGGEAKATAKRSYGGGVYVLSVEATLPDPKNVDYQVWLVGGGKALPIDYMRGTKASWSLALRDSDRYSGYSGIWITLERTRDVIPEEHVMEGSF